MDNSLNKPGDMLDNILSRLNETERDYVMWNNYHSRDIIIECTGIIIINNKEYYGSAEICKHPDIENDYFVAIALDEAIRGYGLSNVLIKRIHVEFFEKYPDMKLRWTVDKDNRNSINLAKINGYTLGPSISTYPNYVSYYLTRRRSVR